MKLIFGFFAFILVIVLGVVIGKLSHGYIWLLIYSLFLGTVAGKFLFKEQSGGLGTLIKTFSIVGIGFSIFGLLYLTVSNFHSMDKKEEQLWETKERQNYSDSNSYIKDEYKKPFSLEEFELTKDSIEVSSVIFTIAGVFLGALGIFWLGYLEESRNQKDREHDQKIQTDRIRSLLTLGIELFKTIDKKVLDFMDDDTSFDCKDDKNCIEVDGKKYKKFTKEEYTKDEKLKIKYEKHLTSLYKFLYESKNFKKQTILEDVYKIIEELQLIFYEQDLILYKLEDSDKRECFLRLLKQYTDYKNFLSGNTEISDLATIEFKAFDKNMKTLLGKNTTDEENPLLYLSKKYKENGTEDIFYETFTKKITKEFAELYLIKESSIFMVFNIADIRDIFLMMQVSSLDAGKFFNAYFKESFKEYIKEKSLYIGGLNLAEKDLGFEEYMEIFENAFNQIESDITSVKELYSLFYSFVKLKISFEQKGGK